MKFLIYLFLPLMLLTACGGNSEQQQADKLSQARELILQGKNDEGRALCDQLYKQHTADSCLTSQQLGDLAVLYMRLYGANGDSETAAEAMNCLDAAFSNNPQALSQFSLNLSEEDAAFMQQLLDVMDQFQQGENAVNDDADQYTPDSLTTLPQDGN